MTRSALIVGTVLAGLLLQTGPQPAAARDKTQNNPQATVTRNAPKAEDTLSWLNPASAQGALYTSDQRLYPCAEAIDGGATT